MNKHTHLMIAFRAVYEVCGINRLQILGSGRQRQLSRARWMVARLLLKVGKSNAHVGRLLGVDHTSVLHGQKRLAALAAADPSVAGMIERVEARWGEIIKDRARDLESFAQKAAIVANKLEDPESPKPPQGRWAPEPISVSKLNRLGYLRRIGWSDKGISRNLSVPLSHVQFLLSFESTHGRPR